MFWILVAAWAVMTTGLYGQAPAPQVCIQSGTQVICGPVASQPVPAPKQTNPAPAPASVSPPSGGGSFYAVGVSLEPTTRPRPTGFAAALVPLSQTQRIYSISEIDFVVVADPAHPKAFQVQTSPRTGAAIWMRDIGPMHLYALGDAGAAISGMNASGAFAGGGMIVYPLGHSRIYGSSGVRVLKTGSGMQTLVEQAIIWGK